MNGKEQNDVREKKWLTDQRERYNRNLFTSDFSNFFFFFGHFLNHNNNKRRKKRSHTEPVLILKIDVTSVTFNLLLLWLTVQMLNMHSFLVYRPVPGDEVSRYAGHPVHQFIVCVSRTVLSDQITRKLCYLVLPLLYINTCGTCSRLLLNYLVCPSPSWNYFWNYDIHLSLENSILYSLILNIGK